MRTSCSAYGHDAIIAQGLWRGEAGWHLAASADAGRGEVTGTTRAPAARQRVAWWKVWAFKGTPGGLNGVEAPMKTASAVMGVWWPSEGVLQVSTARISAVIGELPDRPCPV